MGLLLEGRKALVTGASRGIGREVAKGLAKEGADVVVNFNKNEKMADDIAREIEKFGRNTWVYPASTSNIEEVRKMKTAIEKNFGKIDILVNNAGINIDRLFVKMNEAEWQQVIDVNLTGYFNCSKVFLDNITESKYGRIINIASVVGQMGNIGQVNYAAAKAGVIGMTKALAREMARSKVTVNAIAPGFTRTDMVEGIPEEVKQKILKGIPLGRFGEPEEVAYACVYLASDKAAYITGHVLDINGGMYM
jgi:3-oxoacyl-[acyl-carrier protein] reductase